MRCFWRILHVFLFTGVVLAFAAVAAYADIAAATDKEDYQAGQTASIAGTGWLAGDGTPGVALSPQLMHDWSKRFGGASDQIDQSVTVDNTGNIIATGYYFGTIDFGGGALTSAGSYDIFLAKFDAAGNHLWSKRFGDASGQVGYSVSVDGSGNIFVTGSIQGTTDFGGGALTSAGDNDIFIAKFDPAGNHLWSKRFGATASDIGYGIAIDGSGNIVVAGDFRGTVNFGGGALTSGGDNDVFVAKFDAAGNHLWSKRSGNVARQFARCVGFDDMGNIIVAGAFEGTVDFGGGTLSSAGYFDIFIAKFNAAGAHIWSKRFGSSGRDDGVSVASDGAGNVIMSGPFQGTVNFGGGAIASGGTALFIVKFDAAGAHIWSKGFGSNCNQQQQSLAVDAAGNIITSGYFVGTVNFGGGVLTSAGGADIFIARFDAAGTHLWSQRFGDASGQQGQSVAIDETGGAVLSGFFQGSVDFGGGPLTSAGSYDMFLARFQCDNEAPVPDVNPLPVVEGECSATITMYPTATDNVSGIVVGTTSDPLTYASQGTQTVHWTYTDAAGNSSYQDQTVVVQDLTPPVFVSCAPNITVDADPGMCSKVVTYTYPEVSDNCAGTNVSSTHPPGSSFLVGTTSVTLTASDIGGNTATCAFDVTVLPYPGRTCEGNDVPVLPVDPATGTSPVTITFVDVTGAGETSLEISGVGPPPPFGFKLGAPPTYFELATTATYTGPVTVCIDYSSISFGNEGSLRLCHRENGEWVNRRVSLDTNANIICASVSSLSSFAIFEEVPPASVLGTVTANCPAADTPLYGVTIDVYELGTGSLVGNDVTDENGCYAIENLEAGYYSVTIITPLGYAAVMDEIPVTVEGVDQTADFALTCVEITAQPRGIGFWKHQIGVATGGAGKAEISAAALCGYLDLVEVHFNNHRINAVVIYDPPASDLCADKLLVAKDLLNLKGNVGMTARAKQQLMALLMNVAARKIALPRIISADGATVSQAITYCDRLIDNPEADHETAKTIADLINNGTIVPAGMIPLTTEQIAYDPARPEPDVPVSFALSQNVPNPFNPSTEIQFDLPVDARVDLTVYDVTGRQARRLVGEWMPAGIHAVEWDGLDNGGRAVASGIYFYRIQAGDFTATRRMVLLR